MEYLPGVKRNSAKFNANFNAGTILIRYVRKTTGNIISRNYFATSNFTLLCIHVDVHCGGRILFSSSLYFTAVIHVLFLVHHNNYGKRTVISCIIMSPGEKRQAMKYRSFLVMVSMHAGCSHYRDFIVDTFYYIQLDSCACTRYNC